MREGWKSLCKAAVIRNLLWILKIGSGLAAGIQQIEVRWCLFMFCVVVNRDGLLWRNLRSPSSLLVWL